MLLQHVSANRKAMSGMLKQEITESFAGQTRHE